MFICHSYIEGIPLLYTIPIFIFGHLPTLNSFPSTILPTRLHTIRSLTLNIGNPLASYEYLNEHQRAWANTCKLLASMRGLTCLNVDVHLWKGGFPPIAEYEIFPPLMQIRHVEKFVVRVWWGMRGHRLWGMEMMKDRPYDIYCLEAGEDGLVPLGY